MYCCDIPTYNESVQIISEGLVHREFFLLVAELHDQRKTLIWGCIPHRNFREFTYVYCIITFGLKDLSRFFCNKHVGVYFSIGHAFTLCITLCLL